jgi:hypothetical protein
VNLRELKASEHQNSEVTSSIDDHIQQERERLRIERREREHLEMQASADSSIDRPQYDRDMNNVGLPSPSQYSAEALSQQFRYVGSASV